ncbi:MAG: cyclase, partial [Candidatus Thermoplasmatota archaeon]|nr:cyclase [Candidatus Thermoplasmatota archaeon]
DHDKARKEASSQGGWLFRSHEDPNDITMLIEVADLAKAKALVADPDLKAVMQRAGVVGPPEVALLEKLDDLPY